jgi:hypothetical protein
MKKFLFAITQTFQFLSVDRNDFLNFGLLLFTNHSNDLNGLRLSVHRTIDHLDKLRCCTNSSAALRID